MRAAGAPDSAMAIPAGAWADLLLRVLLPDFSDSWTHWSRRYLTRRPISAAGCTVARSCGTTLVCADTRVALQWSTHAAGLLLDGDDRVSLVGIQFVAPRHAGDLLCLFSVFR